VSIRRLRRYDAFARFEIAAATWLLGSVLALLGRTVRWTRHGTQDLERCWQGGVPVLMVFWHGRAIMLPFIYEGPGASIMNSTHRDGEIVTRVLTRFGIESTRGSSTRGAVAGMLGLVRAHRRGRDLALIPDGPKGPAGVAKGGAAELALATGAPLFPMAVSCSRGWRLPTWDRLLLPRPFASMVLVVGEPLVAPAGDGQGAARTARREALRAELELRLRQVTREADRLAGRETCEEM
jgi:lysophospholipid acyltransferase (LPLAT)-like uncharacterized protein